MAYKDYSYLYDEQKKKRAGEAGNAVASPGVKDYSYLEKRKSFGFDTLQQDLSSMGKTIGDIYTGWKPKETMRNTRSAVEAMQKRLTQYQKYQSQYGGADLSELAKSYQDILDNWDDLARVYGQYDSAEAYEEGVRRANEEYEKMTSANLDELGAELDSLEGILAKAKEYDTNIQKLTNKKNQAEHRPGDLMHDGGYGKKLDAMRAEYQKFLQGSGYQSLDELNRLVDEKKTFRNRAANLQDNIRLTEEIRKDPDFAKYAQEGKIIQKKQTEKQLSGTDWMRERQGEQLEKMDPSYRLQKYGTDEERENYYAYLGKGDKESASRYLNSVEEGINARIAEKIAEEKDTVLKQLGFAVEAGLDQFSQGISKGMNTEADYLPRSVGQIASGYVREEVPEGWGWLYDLTNTTANMAPSLLAGAAVGAIPVVGQVAGPIVGTGLMGASAAGGAYQEKLNLGWDKDQARVYSTAVGIAEAGMQYLLGGIGGLGGKISGKSIKAIANGIDSALGRFAFTYGSKMAAEGLEESMQEIIAPFLENLALNYDKNDMTDVEWGEVAHSGLLGALSAGLLEGVGTGVNTFGENAYAKDMGKNIRENNKVAEMFELASLAQEGSDAKNLLGTYSERGINAENASDLQLGRLHYHTGADAEQSMGQRKTTDEQRGTALQTKLALAEIGKENKALRRAEELASGPDTEAGEGKKQSAIRGIKLGEETKVVTDDGEFAPEELKLSMRDARRIAYAEEMSEENANLFLKLDDGKTDVTDYANSFNLSTLYAKHHFTIDVMLQNKGALSERQVGEIYKATVKAEARARETAIQEISQKQGKTLFVQGTFDDSVIDYKSKTTDDSKVNWNRLSSRQRAAVKFARLFSQATGINIRFYQSKVENGKRKGANGFYNPETNTIELDLYAGMNGILEKDLVSEAIVPVLSHEVTHWMKEKAPTRYLALKEEVLRTLSKEESVSQMEMIQKEMARMRRLHPDMEVTEEAAMDELIARACEDMLTNSKEARKLMENMTEEEKRSFAEKVKDFFDNLIAWADNLLKQYSSNSDEAKVLRANKEKFEKASKMWDEMLASAVEANQVMQNAQESKAEKNTTQEGGVQFSEREIVGVSGKNYGIGVYLDSDVLTGLSENERKKKVKEYVVTKLAGRHFIAYDNQNQAVDIEIARANDTIRNSNGKKRKVVKELYRKNIDKNIKQEAVVLANELIKTAKYDHSSVTNKSHEWLDDYGKSVWDYWKVFIQEKNKTVWEATLNIANSADGKKILYDINPIKKVEGPVKSGPTTTTNSISNSQENVKENFDNHLQFSDREEVSIYDLMGETERLERENQRLKEKVDRLNKRLRLERQVTGGMVLNEHQLDLAAGHLLKIARSNYDKKALAEELNEMFSHMMQAEALSGVEVSTMMGDIAQKILEKAKPEVIVNDYYKLILRDIREGRISLSEEQIKETKSNLGEDWRNRFLGKVVIAKDGMPLSEQWAEWAGRWPEIFDADTVSESQPRALLEVIESLKSASEVVVEYNQAEQIQWIADEIYNQFWNVFPVRTTADKYDAQIKKLKFEHRKAMKEMRDSYQEQLQDQKHLDKEKYMKIIRDLRTKKDREIADAKQKGKDRLAAYKEQAERKRKMQKILRATMYLSRMIRENSKNRHVPEVLRETVIKLVKAIDFSSKQLLEMRKGDESGKPTKQDISLERALRAVKDMVNSKERNDVADLVYDSGMDEELIKLIDKAGDIARDFGDNEFVLNRMSLAELDMLDKMVCIIRQAVSKANKFYAERLAEGVTELGQSTIAELEGIDKKDVRFDKVDKLIKWTNAVPYYAFKRFGSAGMKIFEALQDGLDILAFHIRDIENFTQKLYTAEEAIKWGKDIQEIKVETRRKEGAGDKEAKYATIKMSIPQIMSLYCLLKREQAIGHIDIGGIRIGKFVDKKNKKVGKSEVVHPDVDGLAEIVNLLSPRQKEVADALQKYMSDVCSGWGNQVSMERFGYFAFNEKNYFPIQVDRNATTSDQNQTKGHALHRLLNSSFTKPLEPDADNALIVDNIFDVFAQHATDMAQYNALALPILDAVRWYNFSEKEFFEKGKDGKEPYDLRSVKGAIEKAFGEDGQQYFEKFITDLNGNKLSSGDSIGGKLFSNAKVASVAGNIRVAGLQFTSYFRASAVIDSKYLAKAVLFKPKIAHCLKYCGIAVWKSLGFYDTNISRGAAEQIKHAETKKDKFIEFTLKGAEWADKITWGYLWNACELEIRETRKDLKPGTDAFFDTVSKRLREVIYSTQVVDSVMTRSQAMRSDDGSMKALTAFMSEATLSYNMVQDAFWGCRLDAQKMGKKEAFKKHGKKIARVLYAYTVTNAFSALVEAAFDKLRDTEDEEEFWQLFLENFRDDMSMLNKIPYAKEILSAFDGFSPSRQDVAWMQPIVNATKGLAKNMQGEGNVNTTVKNLVKGASYLTGLPAYNIFRDTMAMMIKLNLFTAEELEDWFNEWLPED
ncbi:MAG: hypothetical protein IJB80_05475 [Clostridia bacterium]|nr:hypothetical protein [Clostridia bacterium]